MIMDLLSADSLCENGKVNCLHHIDTVGNFFALSRFAEEGVLRWSNRISSESRLGTDQSLSEEQRKIPCVPHPLGLCKFTVLRLSNCAGSSRRRRLWAIARECGGTPRTHIGAWPISSKSLIATAG
jgi:hypothetical protein